MSRARVLFFAVLAGLVACGGTSTPSDETAPPTAGSETSVQVEIAEIPERAELPADPSVLEMRSEAPSVTIRVVFDAGSAEDPAGREGLTALTADVMVDGGAGELSFTEVTERLYPMAASMGAITTRDQTAFVARVHRDHLDALYTLFRDALVSPRMEAADFERVKSAQQSRLTLELRGNDDEELGKETLQAMLYEGHRYGHPAAGTERGLEAITLEDAQAHRRRVFCTGRASIGVSGGYPEGFAQRIRDDLSALRFEQCLGRLNVPPIAGRDQPRVWLVDKPEAQAVAISMGFPIDVTRDHPDYPALVLAAAYFGQHRQFAGRLMQRMRGQRGLNYGDYAYAEHFSQDGWTRFPRPNIARRLQYFSVWVRPVRTNQAHFALRMAIRELRDFAENGLQEEELERIRGFASQYYSLYLQTESRRLGFALDDAFYGVETAWLERLRAAWSELTLEQINAAIARHITPGHLEVAIVTPNASDFADTVASEAASPIEYPTEAPADVLAEDTHIVGYEIGIPRERMTIIPLAEIFR